MKVKRYKHAKRVMTFYKNNFSITPPFHILVDGTFCKAALKFQVNIQDQLPKYLGGEVRLYTTRCCLNECEAFGSLLYGPLKVLQQYSVVKCNHRPPVGPPQCLAKVLAKSQAALTKPQQSAPENAQESAHKCYLLATQDPELSELSRAMVGVPLLYISFNAINIESPSESTKLTAAHAPDPTLQEEKLKDLLKKENLLEEKKKPKKKKVKGPNPLSCKKKKKKPTQNNSITAKKSRHKKKRNTKLKIAQGLAVGAVQQPKAGASNST